MTTKPLDQKYAAHLHVPISQFGDMCYKDATTHCFVLTTLAADQARAMASRVAQNDGTHE